jgi:hypothetical protein
MPLIRRRARPARKPSAPPRAVEAIASAAEEIDEIDEIEAIEQLEREEMEAIEQLKRAEPDFVWVGCNTCWHPQDPMSAVRPYAHWLADTFRHRAFFCPTCTANRGAYTEAFPTLWAFWLEDARPFREGGIAPEPTEVKRWGA